MQQEEIEQILLPGYLPVETGYTKLPDGQYTISVHTLFPGFKAKMFEYLFNHYLKDTQTYINAAPNIHISGEWDNKWKPGHYIGASHYIQEYVSGSKLKVKITFKDPAKYFDLSKFKDPGVIIYADAYLDYEIPHGSFIHVIRDTEWGCERRSRYCIPDCSEDFARGFLKNCVDASVSYSILLKNLSKGLKNEPNISVKCKFCQSEDVIKNGSRHNVQYYLCKTCGHAFTNNGALPGMKYPTDIMATTVNDFYSGKPLYSIRNYIEDSTSTMPSNSTIYSWINKVTVKALAEVDKFQPKVTDTWILRQTSIPHLSSRDNSRYGLFSIEDADTHFSLGIRFYCSRDVIDINSLIEEATKLANRVPKKLIIIYDDLDFYYYINNLSKYEYLNNTVITPQFTLHVSPEFDTSRLHQIFTSRFNLININNLTNNKGNASIILKGFLFHYNYLTPHQSLNGLKPAEAAGIPLPDKNWLKWCSELE
jgi:transposase-like protein